MKVRWLGNSCVEIQYEKNILIDPNFVVEPEEEPDIVLVTHEHDDHLDPEQVEGLGAIELFAPQATLDKFDLDGDPVDVGMYIGPIQVLDSDCWNAYESVSYFYQGVLHTGDSAWFPEVQGVELAFTACFPDYYDDYISVFKRLEPGLVIPFHYDVDEGMDDAEGLKERMDKEGIPNELLEPGGSVEV